MSAFVIELAAGTGNLERLLNKCRRKGHLPRALAVGVAAEGGLRVVVDFVEPSADPARIAADLAKVYDVIAIEHRPDSGIPDALDAAVASA